MAFYVWLHISFLSLFKLSPFFYLLSHDHNDHFFHFNNVYGLLLSPFFIRRTLANRQLSYPVSLIYLLLGLYAMRGDGIITTSSHRIHFLFLLVQCLFFTFTLFIFVWCYTRVQGVEFKRGFFQWRFIQRNTYIYAFCVGLY